MITIFRGPKTEFEKILPQHCDRTNLIELADKHDRDRRQIRHVNEQQSFDYEEDIRSDISCLIAYSDEYSGLSDHAIQSFLSFLGAFNIEDIYLQNPPEYIVEQLKKSGKRIEYQEHVYAYIDLNKLSLVANEYDKHIIGQPNVKRQLIASLYPIANGNFNKPCVILFYGPTGVGKTETAKFLSEVLNEKLFRKQFSMFQNQTFAEYLFGSKHSQNSFAKELLERESNIILLDEFDKPNPIFFSAFYQLFDEGIFEDKNYNVKIEKAILICTSNFLSEADIQKQLGEPIYSRFDAIIRFDALSLDSIKQIINLEFNKEFSKLTSEEKAIIEEHRVLETSLQKASGFKNARHVKRLIREAIYLIIGDQFIEKSQKEKLFDRSIIH